MTDKPSDTPRQGDTPCDDGVNADTPCIMPREEDKIPGKCNALCRPKLNNDGMLERRWCTQKAMANGRCRQHGGMSLGGADSPRYVHGRHSRYLTGRMAENYEVAINDPKLVHLTSEIALLDARLGELLQQSGGGRAWRDAEVAFRGLDAAIKSGDAAGIGNLLSELREIITEGAAEAKLWREIRGTIDDRRKLAEAQRRLAETMGTMVAVERVVALLTAIESLVRENVTDKRQRAVIANGIRKLTGE